jgi:hypothetical protein
MLVTAVVYIVLDRILEPVAHERRFRRADGVRDQHSIPYRTTVDAIRSMESVPYLVAAQRSLLCSNIESQVAIEAGLHPLLVRRCSTCLP